VAVAPTVAVPVVGANVGVEIGRVGVNAGKVRVGMPTVGEVNKVDVGMF
jgi:hypothetical protein